MNEKKKIDKYKRLATTELTTTNKLFEMLDLRNKNLLQIGKTSKYFKFCVTNYPKWLILMQTPASWSSWYKWSKLTQAQTAALKTDNPEEYEELVADMKMDLEKKLMIMNSFKGAEHLLGTEFDSILASNNKKQEVQIIVNTSKLDINASLNPTRKTVKLVDNKVQILDDTTND